jgi:hypothetical protein
VFPPEVRLTVVVVTGAEVTVVTLVVVVVALVGELMTTPVAGNATTPIEDFRVGPLGLLWGTKMMPNVPARIKEKETAHNTKCVGRFFLRDFTSLILV